MKTILLMCFFAATPYALASELVGSYEGAGPGGHYGKVTIKNRGADYLLSTCGYYGNICAPITAVLRQEDTNSFNSIAGMITAYYGALKCSYSIRLRVVLENDRIFLSEFGPGRFPPSARQCPAESALNYGDYIETLPYMRSSSVSLP